MKKLLCYANLNSFNSSEKITDEHMRKYFEATIDTAESEIVDIIIDRVNPEIYYNKRDGWKKLISVCEAGKIDMIVVPASSMITAFVADLISLIRGLKIKYGCAMYFIRERISTSEPNVEQTLQIHAMIEEHVEVMKRSEREMKKEFFAVNSVDGEPDAVPIFIDNKQYDKVEEFGQVFGTNAQGLVQWFFAAVIDPQNYELFEKMLGLKAD